MNRAARMMSEDELQENVRELCRTLGLEAQHIHDSRRCWLPGWPDLEILGHGRIIHRELKTMTGTLKPEQRRVGSLIVRGGGSWSTWRPIDWVNGTIERQLREISAVQGNLFEETA